MPESVHIFISTGRFKSFEVLREFIDETYDHDGNGIPSQFMIEVGVIEYEPMCIEAISSDTGQPISLTQLLQGASYADRWLLHIDSSVLADAAICVFEPNQLSHPERSSLAYLGCLPFTF